MARLVCWYSHGAASLIAAKKAIEMAPERYPDHEIVVANIFIEDEYQEPERLDKVAEYLGVEMLFLRDRKYEASVDEVIKRRKYMSGVRGAPCTKELKKAVRKDWQLDDDVHVFGMTIEEEHRIDRILDAEPELEIFAPLIELGMTKQDCFNQMKAAGLELPMMYKLGYHNNNCIGCVKAGGAGYWNKIRVDFPEVFEKRSRQEYLCNTALCSMSRDKFMSEYPEHYKKMCDEWEDRFKVSKQKRKGGTIDYKTSLIPLRFLPEDAGSHKDLDIGDCGFVCEMNQIDMFK